MQTSMFDGKKQFMTKTNIKISNKFHRVEECGKVGETKCR